MYAQGDIPLENILPRPDQRFRCRLVFEAYHLWLSSKMSDPRTVLTNLAKREYADYLRRAKTGEQEAVEMVEALKIREGVPRSFNEISNDIYTLNWLVGRFDTSEKNIIKAAVIDMTRWQARFGQQTGDWRAVDKASDRLTKLYDNFKDEENPADQLQAGAGFGITDDVSVVKADRTNYTPEQVAKFERKYGLTKKETAIAMEEQNGVWVPAEPDLQEEQPDIFEQDGMPI